jgi:prepilin peptidase CpaA
MSKANLVAIAGLLIPLAVFIAYYDIRYRRIPNILVLATMLSGLLINLSLYGRQGALISLGGAALGLGVMLVMHVFGALGAGDVKLFSAICAVVGYPLVLPTFCVVILLGGVLGIITMIRAQRVAATMHGVSLILTGLFLPGRKVPRISVPADRSHTIPYGVAITLGSLLSLVIFYR